MVVRAALVALLAALFALAVAFEAPLCPTAALFGVPCPGCGLTRATLRLLRGDVHGALRFHPLVPVLAPLVAFVLGAAIVRFVAGPRVRLPRLFPPRHPLVTGLGVLLLVAVLGVWAARFFGAFGGPVPVRSLVMDPS
ncbi:MAG: DUF2752 domain-containing protein [Pseudomonadota bacterium]|nr:MAG: DUF2752 domain-containing protein [Pseudomonadota bacterium]